MESQQQGHGCSRMESRERSAKKRARRAAENAARGSLYAPYLLGVDHILERVAQDRELDEPQRTSVMAVAAMVRDFLEGKVPASTSNGVLTIALAAQGGDYLGDCLDDLLRIFTSAVSIAAQGPVEAGEWAEDYVKHNYCERASERAVRAAEAFATRLAKLAEEVTGTVPGGSAVLVEEPDAARRASTGELAKANATDGVLIVDGMKPLNVAQVVERCGGRVYFAREAADGASVLDVRMDNQAANAVALAMVDVPMRYLPVAPASAQNNDSSTSSIEGLQARVLHNAASDAEEVEYRNRVLAPRGQDRSTSARDEMTRSVQLTAPAVAQVIHILQNLFRPGADWEGDILPAVPADGLGLVAVAAAQDAYRRIGARGAAGAMFSFLCVYPRLGAECANDERAAFAASTLRGICEGSVSMSEERDRDELYEACTPREDDSLFASCMLFVVRAALSADHDPTDYDWSVLNIANDLAARVGKDAALDFAGSLYRAGQQPARAA
ncbi:MAG TPA: hypothetical protein VMF89_02900 [Polyangiales bacterium]|nr:hypothetical protein [Polyangiales bacterium]